MEKLDIDCEKHGDDLVPNELEDVIKPEDVIKKCEINPTYDTSCHAEAYDFVSNDSNYFVTFF